MKTFLTLLCTGLLLPVFAQDVTTVSATDSRIGDNLDLRAVASIFADSDNLEDFERRLNNPNNRINNLDLNFDGRVDYLRVIETVEDYTHLIVVQAVLDRDVFQDVATIDVQRDNNNNVQVQFVGDVYMYGPNYIYEPVFVYTPVIYRSFWAPRYRAYCSPFYWDYYPSFYTYWSPFPIYTYRNNVNVFINVNHQYNYVNTRRNTRAVALYNGRRADGYERFYSNRTVGRSENNGRNSVTTTRSSGRNNQTGTRTTVSNPSTNGGRNRETTVQTGGVRPARNSQTVNTSESTGRSTTVDRQVRGNENSNTVRSQSNSNTVTRNTTDRTRGTSDIRLTDRTPRSSSSSATSTTRSSSVTPAPSRSERSGSSGNSRSETRSSGNRRG
ncbi:hypothetical protein [Flavobacterium sp.]|uniref:hypothetical protein n=1 Tax=Flavobacterium sp. TaxID=239 RepID=UPI003B9D906B